MILDIVFIVVVVVVAVGGRGVFGVGGVIDVVVDDAAGIAVGVAATCVAAVVADPADIAV